MISNVREIFGGKKKNSRREKKMLEEQKIDLKWFWAKKMKRECHVRLFPECQTRVNIPE